jgi:hypothetical protein
MHFGVLHVQAFDDGVPEKFTALNDPSAHDLSHDDQSIGDTLLFSRKKQKHFPISKGLIWLMFHPLQVRQSPMEN